MEIENTPIEGLKLIHLDKFVDERGTFFKVFNSDFLVNNGLESYFLESYYSISRKNVIRGMHFQKPPFEHTKLVYLNQGKVLDVVLDIRKKSKTFGKCFSLTLNKHNQILIYIPKGIAHGFLSQEDNSMISYLQTSVYNKDSDSGILWNSIGVEWGVENPIISDRDNSFSIFDTYETPFL